MPLVSLPTPDDYETIVGPVVFTIVNDLLKDYAAPGNPRIVFPGKIAHIAQPKSTISDKRNDENNFLKTDNTVNIEITEIPIESRVLTTAVTRQRSENVYIFHDEELGINLRPVITPVELDISFRFRFKDRTGASNYIANLKTRTSMGRAEQLHTLVYHYGIPHEYVYMLTEMYRIRENVDPLNETMLDWFKRTWTNRMRVITNQAGHMNTAVIVIPENQLEVLGWYDFTFQPDAEDKENDEGAYTCGFNYKVQYDKVTDVVIEYPLMIHNQILPKTIRDDLTDETPDTITRTSQHSRYLFEFMKSQQPRYKSGIEGYCVPLIDDWVVSKTHRGVGTLLTVLIEVNALDKRELFNIEDIEEFEFHQEILDFLVIEAPYISHIGRSVFYFNLYEKDTSTGMDKITMDTSLNLRTVDEMSLRKVQHFHFGLITDWTMLDEDALNRLRRFPGVIWLLLYAILGDYLLIFLQNNSCLLNPMSNGSISLSCMKSIIDMLSIRKVNVSGFQTGNPGGNYDAMIARLTTGSYRIVAIRNNV